MFNDVRAFLSSDPGGLRFFLHVQLSNSHRVEGGVTPDFEFLPPPSPFLLLILTSSAISCWCAFCYRFWAIWDWHCSCYGVVWYRCYSWCHVALDVSLGFSGSSERSDTKASSCRLLLVLISALFLLWDTLRLDAMLLRSAHVVATDASFHYSVSTLELGSWVTIAELGWRQERRIRLVEVDEGDVICWRFRRTRMIP